MITISYNEREFVVEKMKTKTDYIDYLCNSASGIKLVFRRWLDDNFIEYKGEAKRVWGKT